MAGITMKRSLQGALLGVAAAATLVAAPCVTPSARAQSAPPLENLDLTSAQRGQVEELREDLRRSLYDILTNEQRTQFQNAFRTARHIPTAMATVDNLKPRQKVRIRSALKEFQRELSSVLTKEQLAELRMNREQRRQGLR
jgi:Spy/CpxP family protein refolding chaperone